MTTTLQVRKQRGIRTITGSPSSSLRSGMSLRRAEIRTVAGTYTAHITDYRRLGVVTRAGERPVVRLHPDGSQVPGPGGPVSWSPGRHSATLTRDASRISVYLPRWPRGPVRVEVTGDWAELDLVVLTICFALLTRRRRRTIMAMAIAGG